MATKLPAPTIWNKIAILILALIVVAFIYFLGPVLTPFLIGLLLAYLANPLVNQFMRLHLSRFTASLIVFSLMFMIIIGLFVLLVPLVQTQLMQLTEMIPDAMAWIQNTLAPWITTHFNTQLDFGADPIKKLLSANLTKTEGAISWFLSAVLFSGHAFFMFLLYLILIPLVTFYTLRDWNTLLASILQLIPKRVKPTFLRLVRECDRVLSEFLRGQLLVMLALAFYYAIGLSLLGLKVGLMIGILIGILSIVPYLGFFVGIFITIVATLIEFGDFNHLLWVVILFAIGHAVENFFLTPLLIGDRIGLHPVIVIFAVLAGGSLFGLLGVLLALPLAAVIMVFLRYTLHRYHHSKLYQE